MAFDALSAADWYESPGRGWVAIIRAVPGFDPEPLVGQLVTINGTPRVIKGVEKTLPTGVAPSDATGTTIGLLV
jgi:hypothetical protein